MSTFGEGDVRVVTLGVFDKDDNYTKTKEKSSTTTIVHHNYILTKH